MQIQRKQAEELLNRYVKTPHIIKHSYAVEAVMRALAKKLAPEEEEEWAIAGLLHDLDNDSVDWEKDMSLHGPKTIELMIENGVGNEKMYQAILAHNPLNGSSIETTFDRAMYAADPITGFITAIALVYPDKKIKSVKTRSILKRMKEKRFAAGANRDAMKSIEDLGIPFEEFASLSLSAMCEIEDILGL